MFNNANTVMKTHDGILELKVKLLILLKMVKCFFLLNTLV